MVKLVWVSSTVIVSVFEVYPSADTVTETSPSAIPVNVQPPALPVVLSVPSIVTVAPSIASFPSLMVNEISLVVWVSSPPSLSSGVLS